MSEVEAQVDGDESSSERGGSKAVDANSEPSGTNAIAAKDRIIADRKKKIEALKLYIIAYFFSIILQIVYFLAAAITPLLTIALFILIDHFVSPIPVVTVSPFGLQLQGDGIPVTTFLIAGGVGKIAKRLWGLNSKGWPSIELNEGSEN